MITFDIVWVLWFHLRVGPMYNAIELHKTRVKISIKLGDSYHLQVI